MNPRLSTPFDRIASVTIASLVIGTIEQQHLGSLHLLVVNREFDRSLSRSRYLIKTSG